MSLFEHRELCLTNYEVLGDTGPALLLFNGATIPLGFWGTMAPRLARHCRVVLFDQRDAGLTRFSGDFSLLDTAADGARLLDHLGIEKACVVGHARGGRAAQVFARDFPHRTAGLAICGTGGRFPSPGARERLTRLDQARRDRDREALADAVQEMYCAPGFRARSPERFGEIVDAVLPMPVAQGRWDPAIAPSESYWGTASARTLLIYGRHDRDGTPANAEDLQRRLSAKLVMFEDAGHFVVREKEDEVVELLLGFAGSLF